MAAFIPDSSATLAWCFEDEATPQTDALLDRLQMGDGALVPAHWPFEVGNVLIMAERRGRLLKTKREQFLQQLRTLPIQIDADTVKEAFRRSLELAERHVLTVYDAAYLELALRSNSPLATLDGQLRKAARAEEVGLLL